MRRVAAQVHRVAIERGADIIFAAMAFSWVAATPVARQLGIPIVWRAGGTEGGFLERLALRAWAAFNPPDLLICCGEDVRRMFAPLIPAPAVVTGSSSRRATPRRSSTRGSAPRARKW